MVKFTTSEGRISYSATTIVATAPAIFTVNQNGSGAAVALDAFNFTQAPFAAVRPGGEANIIAVFGTALGNDATDESTTATITGNVNESVRATIDGQAVAVNYAGPVSGLTGLNQLNVVLPAGLAAGLHRLKVTRNGVPSNEVTITIR